MIIKKLLLVIAALTAMTAACAQGIDTAASHATVTPEGTARPYEGDALLETISEIGYGHARSIANTLYFADGGATVYVNSMFHNTFLPDALWMKGKVEDGKLVFDCEETVYKLVYNDESREADDLKFGEIVFDAKGKPYTAKNAELLIDGDRFYVKDNSNAPSRTFALYIDRGTDIEIYDFMYCPNLVPYTGNVEAVTVPESAVVSDYTYFSSTWYGAKKTTQGHIAVDGNDYYFDSLLPDIGAAWVKGTRKGNKITLPNDQFLGYGTGFYIYYKGWYVTGIDYNSYQYTGEFRDLTLTVGSDGSISLDNPTKANPGAYRPDDSEYAFSYETVIKPYKSEAGAVPSDPYDISMEYSSEYQCYVLDFLLDNVSTEGTFLDPEHLGYYIYIDGERYTFTRKKYPYLDREELTLVPYNYTDIYEYDILCRDIMHEIYLYEEGFTTVGVQAVYETDGVVTTSHIVDAIIEGGIEDGIHTISTQPASEGTWYDLSGRPANANQRGILIKGGRIILR